jgi:hypothetical protein
VPCVANFVLGSGRDHSRLRIVHHLYSTIKNERDSVKIYKKCSRDGEAKQHRALTAVLTIMRLSFLALFIALPAAAYAAVCPQQHPTIFEDECAERGDFCSYDIPCCGRLVCEWNGYGSVCLMLHLLCFTLGTDPNAAMQLSRTRLK